MADAEPETEEWWILEKQTDGRASTTEAYAGPYDDYIEAMNDCPDDAPGSEFNVVVGPIDEQVG
jgi:hypothetical protein